MKKKEDLRVTKTKKNLYEGLLKLMKDKTFEEIKVSDICSISLTNRSTFYDHFTDKFELFESLIEDLETELTVKLEENTQIDKAKDYYMEMIKLFLDHIGENITIYSSILKKNNNSIVMDMIHTTILKDVEKHLAKVQNVAESIPPDIVSKFYVSAVANVCIDYLKNPNKYTKEEIIIYLDKLIPNKIY